MTDHKAREGAAWDDARCRELEQLEILLVEVAAINNGSGCLTRIARCIEIASKLDRFDFGSGRASFREFLRERAIADRFPKKEPA